MPVTYDYAELHKICFVLVFIFGGEGGHCMYLFKKSMHMQFQ